uniref:AAA+ ATPase domain-containing protein n=1 Tax=Glossina brevipalpis TaxID=37001 RepID=A0A1A9WCB6_9MUSC
MSGRKKWVTSAFNQISTIDNAKVATPPAARSPGVNLNKTNGMKRNLSDNFETVQESGNNNVTQNMSQENWLNIFAPNHVNELAIHSKKVMELREWLQQCETKQNKQPAQICLLSGPSGCGKTAAVFALSKELNFYIKEWINPVDQEIVHNLGDQGYKESYKTSQWEAFKSFLFQASRYRSILGKINDKKRLLMVEDFPNFLLKSPDTFQEILEDYQNYGKSPLIFIVTESRSRGLNISYNLFTDQFKQKFLIQHISFNAIASTLMQKAMKRFCSIMAKNTEKEMYKVPDSAITDSIVVSAQGDIRNALINLHFAALNGIPGVLVTSSEKPKDSKSMIKKRKSQSSLKSIGKDESITMMHALGRALNPKYIDNQQCFLHSPEDIADAFASEPKTFTNMLQTNYLSHFREIECVAVASNGLSLSDLLFQEYREDTLPHTSLNIAIRSVMVANKQPVSAWLPIKAPKRLLLKHQEKLPKEAAKFLIHPNNISSNLYNTDYNIYVKIMSQQNK